MKAKRVSHRLKNQLDFVFENLPTKDFVSPKQLEKVKTILNNSYNGASTYNHTPKIDELIVSLGGGTGKVSSYLFFFHMASLSLILRQLTYLYILAYPMSLFPIDRYKKWGYGGPVGLFFDFANFAIIKEFLGGDNLQKMKTDFQRLQEVKDLSSWYEEQLDLTEFEIENTWQEFIKDKPNSDVDGRGHRTAIFTAHSRGVGWFVNYFHEPMKSHDEISDEMLEKVIKRINNW